MQEGLSHRDSNPNAEVPAGAFCFSRMILILALENYLVSCYIRL